MAVTILITFGAYVAVGVAFAVVFLARGVHTLDHGTRGAPPAFYVLIFPGIAALWPVMLRKWLRARRSGG